MPETVCYTELCRELGLQFGDVDIALARVPYKSQLNRRLYKTTEALDALEAFYSQKAADNNNRYDKYRKQVYRDRAARAEAHAAQVREWRQAHEQPIQ